MRILVPTIMALSLISSAALAGQAGPLAAGKPAGLRQAQEESNRTVLLIGIAVVAAGIAIVASQSNDSAPVTPPTTGTAP